MKLRLPFVLTVVLATVILVSGPARAQSLDGTLKKIHASKTFTVGYREDSWPFSFADKGGKPPDGYSVELCKRVTAGVQQQLGLEALDVKYVPVTAQSRIQAVVDGKADIECGISTITLSRMEKVDFSNMIFVDGGGLLSKKSAPIARFGDLSDKRVAVIPGTTTDTALRDALSKQFIKANLVSVKEHSEGLAAVESGKADAYASDRTILVGLILNAKDPLQFGLSPDQFSYEPYGLMLKRGDASFRLAVNRVLAKLYRSGEIAEIYKKWFGPLGDPSGVLLAMYILNSLPE